MRAKAYKSCWIVLLAAGALLAIAAPGAGHAGATAARARPRLRVPSPDGRRVVEVRAQPRGGDGLWLDGRRVWPDDGGAHTIGVLAWSRGGDAVAFVARGSAVHELVVVVAPSGVAPAAMRWAIPGDTPPRAITWLGPSRVGVGPALLDPKVVASWQTALR